MDLRGLLAHTVEVGGPDLHLKVGEPPVIQVDGELQRVEGAPDLTEYSVEQILNAITANAPAKREHYLAEGDIDTSHTADGAGRYRLRTAPDGRPLHLGREPRTLARGHDHGRIFDLTQRLRLLEPHRLVIRQGRGHLRRRLDRLVVGVRRHTPGSDPRQGRGARRQRPSGRLPPRRPRVLQQHRPRRSLARQRPLPSRSSHRRRREGDETERLLQAGVELGPLDRGLRQRQRSPGCFRDRSGRAHLGTSLHRRLGRLTSCRSAQAARSPRRQL